MVEGVHATRARTDTAPPDRIKSRDQLTAAEIARCNALETQIIDAAVERLRALADVPLGRAPTWGVTTWQVANDLHRLANSPWSKLQPAAAEALVQQHAPRDAGFGDSRIAAALASARHRMANEALVPPSPAVFAGLREWRSPAATKPSWPTRSAPG